MQQCELLKTNKGGIKLNCDGFTYDKNRFYNEKYYWVCEKYKNKQYN